MTAELALPGTSLAPIDVNRAASNTPVEAPSLVLGRRLERLRASRKAVGPGLRPVEPEGSRARALALAEGLGGRLLDTGHGPLVTVESVVRLPLERQALLRLPFAGLGDGPLTCLDLETTGLGTGTGTLAFLVGIGLWQEDDLVIRQFVLPDHADEAAFLAALAGMLPVDACLVTYNGRSFDWPILVTRFRIHRRDPPQIGGHLDLLPVARQLWRHRMGNARLATVEAAICAVDRGHDLPGALVPECYFGYLRHRRPEQLREVVEHNRQDIVSLGRLLQVLAVQMSSPEGWSQAHPGDLAGLARAYSRRRRHDQALECLEAALASRAWQTGIIGGAGLYRRLATERALSLARLGRRNEAVAAWHELAVRGGPGAALAWIKIAVHREHLGDDPEGALAACRQAASIAAQSRRWAQPQRAIERDLRTRVPRLQRRLGCAWRDTAGNGLGAAGRAQQPAPQGTTA